MPIYEYRTENGRTFELFFRRADDAGDTATDPATGETGTRIMSGAGFAFKGSGFYLTDYGKNAHRGGSTAPAKGGDSGGDGGTSNSAKSEGATSEGSRSAGGSSESKGGESKSAAPSTPAASAPASAPASASKKASE